MRSEENVSEKWRIKSCFLLYNAPEHRKILVKDLLAQNVTKLQHLPYSPDLVPTDFYLFPQMKSALKGRRFCDATDVIKNAKKELKRHS